MYKIVPDYLKILYHVVSFCLFTAVLFLFGMTISSSAGIVAAMWLFLLLRSLIENGNTAIYRKLYWKVKNGK